PRAAQARRRARLPDADVRARGRPALQQRGATKLLDPLVAAGLACREPDPADRRTVYAALTNAGRERLGAANRDHLKAIQREFGTHLRPDEVATVAAFLRRLAGGAD
ncbi:MAG TPA: hypothetical protein VI011_25830, partial [Asanoa sp.]